MTTSTNDPVVARVWFEIVGSPTEVNWGESVEVELEYRPEDPFAVRVTFLVDNVVWVFARELLSTGLSVHTGLGDVQVWPGLGVVNIRLESGLDDNEWIVFRTLVRPVRKFVAKTYIAVPSGQEPGWLNLDTLVAQLLSDI